MTRLKHNKFPLPRVVQPSDYVCLTMKVPNDADYIGNIFGAIWELCQANSHADDPDHKAKEVAKVWKRLYFDLQISNCVDAPVMAFGEYEDMPRFRDHCDHELFYLGCDDTEHQIAFLSDIPAGGQAGSGAPQPTPGGGHQNYCQTLNANQQMFLPVLINSGDTIELVSAKGGWWDGGEQALGFPIWRCPDGEQFIAKDCAGAGSEHITGTDPVVGAAHMSLIVYIGATAYSLASGVVTVPGGVTNGNAVVQVNDTAISNNQGSADVCIKVTNNAAGSWTQDINFTLTDGGFVAQVVGGTGHATWAAGIGWQPNPSYNIGVTAIQLAALHGATVTHAKLYFLYDPTSGSAAAAFFGDNITISPSPSQQTVDYSVPQAVSPGTLITLQLNEASGGTNHLYIQRITYTGTGVNPFV